MAYFGNFIGENQLVTLKMKPLDQNRSIDAHKLNHTANLDKNHEISTPAE